VAGLKDPPRARRVSGASECLLRAGVPRHREGAGRRGESAAALSEPIRSKLRGQMAFLRIRGAPPTSGS